MRLTSLLALFALLIATVFGGPHQHAGGAEQEHPPCATCQFHQSPGELIEAVLELAPVMGVLQLPAAAQELARSQRCLAWAPKQGPPDA